MGRRSNRWLIAVVLGLLVAAPAAQAAPRSACHYTHVQAVAKIKAAIRKGPKAERALVKANVKCHARRKGAHSAAVAAPDPMAIALLQASGNNAIGQAEANSMTETPAAIVPDAPGTNDTAGPVIPDPAGPNSLPQRAVKGGSVFGSNLKRPIAHAASCWPGQQNTVRVYDGAGNHMMTLTKTVGGWCGNGVVVQSVSNWGHLAPWMNPAFPTFCIADFPTYGHGPDGSYPANQGGHSTWAHGYAIQHLGYPGSGGHCDSYYCVRAWWSIIRLAGDGYSDHYNDYGFTTKQSGLWC